MPQSVSVHDGRLRTAIQKAESLGVIQAIVRSDPTLIRAKDDDGWLPLHYAVYHCSKLQVVRYLVSECPGALQERDDDGYLPLHIAAEHAQVEVVDYLSKQWEPALRTKDVDGWLPLHFAVAYALLDTVRTLVDMRPEALLEKEQRGFLPLHVAVDDDSMEMEVIRFIVDACPKALQMKTMDGWLPLHVAVQHEAPLDVVKALVDDCPEALLAKDKDGRLPLHVAAEGKVSSEVVQFLVDQSPETLLVKDEAGWLPLHIAATKASVKVVQCLVDKCPDAVRVKDKGGRLALHLAGRYASVTIVRLLADIYPKALKVKDKAGWLPLHVAAKHASLEVVQYIACQAPLALLVPNSHGWLPLHVASAHAPLEVIRCLVGMCPEALQEETNDGWLALHISAQHAPVEVVRLLVHKYREAITVKEQHGWLPLHIAVKYASLEVVRLLVAACPETLLDANNRGWLPLHFAVNHAPRETVEYLVDECKQIIKDASHGFLPYPFSTTKALRFAIKSWELGWRCRLRRRVLEMIPARHTKVKRRQIGGGKDVGVHQLHVDIRCLTSPSEASDEESASMSQDASAPHRITAKGSERASLAIMGNVEGRDVDSHSVCAATTVRKDGEPFLCPGSHACARSTNAMIETDETDALESISKLAPTRVDNHDPFSDTSANPMLLRGSLSDERLGSLSDSEGSPDAHESSRGARQGVCLSARGAKVESRHVLTEENSDSLGTYLEWPNDIDGAERHQNLRAETDERRQNERRHDVITGNAAAVESASQEERIMPSDRFGGIQKDAKRQSGRQVQFWSNHGIQTVRDITRSLLEEHVTACASFEEETTTKWAYDFNQQDRVWAEPAAMCTTWLFPRGAPSDLMEPILIGVLLKLNESSPHSQFRLNEVFCCRSSLVIEIYTSFTKAKNEEPLWLPMELLITLVDQESTLCVGTRDLHAPTAQRLIACAKGFVAHSRSLVWRGGYGIALESIRASLANAFKNLQQNAPPECIACPECLQKLRPNDASTLNCKLLKSAGAAFVFCRNGHLVDNLIFDPHDRHRFAAIQDRAQPILREDVPAAVLRSIVLVGVSFEDETSKIGSGFVAERNHGLILTAAHTLRTKPQKSITQIQICVINKDGSGIASYYTAEIPVLGTGNVDACVLRITGCASRSRKPVLSHLQELKLASESSMGENVRLIGYNQGGEGVAESGTSTFPDCRRDELRGYVCKYSMIPMGGGIREEIVIDGGRVIEGQSGGPCLNARCKVLGILSRHDYFNGHRWYLVPYWELQKLLQTARALCRAERNEALERYGGWFKLRRGKRNAMGDARAEPKRRREPHS